LNSSIEVYLVFLYFKETKEKKSIVIVLFKGKF